mgnify:CR=1 FL=1
MPFRAAMSGLSLEGAIGNGGTWSFTSTMLFTSAIVRRTAPDPALCLEVWTDEAATTSARPAGPGQTDDAANKADQLSAARRALGERLEAAVTGELEGLQMRGARLSVAFEPLAEAGPTGAETVTLLLTAHPGAPALPLGKGVSGGELSRIVLALEVVLAEAGEHEREAAGTRRTLVFDEVDSGVGGRAALEVGRRLARLARSTQVVVVTHLAQVAAWAATQLVVLKEQAPAGDGADGGAGPGPAGRTRTRVAAVEGAEREKELARMLSGHEDSDAALRHAAELLEEAAVAQSQA